MKPLQVFHDTDDFDAVEPDGHEAAERFAVGPEVPGERLVHDDDARTVCSVAVVEFAGQRILVAVSRNGITRLADDSQSDFHAD